MNLSKVLDNEKEMFETIFIKEVLTYETVAPIVARLLDEKIGLIKCENIKEIDITGIQFLQSIKRYYKEITIEANFTNEVSNLLTKAGYKF